MLVDAANTPKLAAGHVHRHPSGAALAESGRQRRTTPFRSVDGDEDGVGEEVWRDAEDALLPVVSGHFDHLVAGQ